MKKPGRYQRQDAPQKKSGGGMLLGLFLGLVVGVLIAFGVVLYLNKAPLPFMNKYEGAPREPAKAVHQTPPPEQNGTSAAAPAPAQPLTLPGKPGDKVGEKPRFDFYGILEGKQQATPGTAVPPAPTSAAAEKTATKPAKPAETYYLQAGAFQKAADADNLKAKLTMMGVDVNVQEVAVPEKGTLHRVRVGPLGSADEMNRVRTQLSQSGVQATVVKQKD